MSALRLGLVAVGLLVLGAACGRKSVCEKELDRKVECGLVLESVADDIDKAQLRCDDDSERGCASLCALDAFDIGGCEGLAGGAASNYLVCLQNCVPDTAVELTPP